MRLAPVALTALVFLLAPVLHAEDWTVNGKDYHNVKVTKVDPDTASIMYDGGIGTVNLSDLTPDLQKRYGYDPKAAQAAAHAKAVAQAQADAELQRGLRLESIKVQYAADIEKVSKSPLKLFGTVVDVKTGMCIVSAGGNETKVPHYNDITGITTYTTTGDPTPMVLRGQGGMCMLISNQAFSVNQAIDMSAVYTAGFIVTGGKFYMRYADDPAVAYQLANNLR